MRQACLDLAQRRHGIGHHHGVGVTNQVLRQAKPGPHKGVKAQGGKYFIRNRNAAQAAQHTRCGLSLACHLLLPQLHHVVLLRHLSSRPCHPSHTISPPPTPPHLEHVQEAAVLHQLRIDVIQLGHAHRGRLAHVRVLILGRAGSGRAGEQARLVSDGGGILNIRASLASAFRWCAADQ